MSYYLGTRLVLTSPDLRFTPGELAHMEEERRKRAEKEAAAYEPVTAEGEWAPLFG